MPVKTRQTFTDRSTVSLAAEVQPAAYNLDRLRYDYEQIDEEHRERVQYATVAIQDHMSRATQSVIEAGKELLEIREILPHGQFLDWVEAEFGISERMAQHLMNAGRVFGANPKRVTGFSDSAIYLLAAPSMPDEVREEILTEAETTGQPATRKDIAARKPKQSKPQPESEPTPEPATDDPVAWAAAQPATPEPDPFAASYAAVQGEPDEPERYTVTLAAEAYHALRAAVLAGALRVYADGATVEEIKRALAEAMGE